jgi:hypothetical protein
MQSRIFCIPSGLKQRKKLKYTSAEVARHKARRVKAPTPSNEMERDITSGLKHRKKYTCTTAEVVSRIQEIYMAGCRPEFGEEFGFGTPDLAEFS